MGYDEKHNYGGALAAAGATVIAYQPFGSYQGRWWALVEHDGRRGWVTDYFGSCSGCDALEADMGWYPWDGTSEEMAGYRRRLALFGARYLAEPLLTDEQALAKAGEDAEWDMEAADMVAFVRAHSGHSA